MTKETEASGTSAPAPRYDREQIAEALGAMTRADVAKVRKAASWLASRSGTSAEDLSQEAYLRALDTRTCSVGTSIVGFLVGTMRSIASEGPRSRNRAREECGLEVVFLGNYGDEGLPHPKDGNPSPEDAALSKVIQSRQIARAEAAIAHDEALQLLVMGEFDGMRGQDLQDVLGVDTKGLAAARKRLARTVRKAFVEGSGL